MRYFIDDMGGPGEGIMPTSKVSAHAASPLTSCLKFYPLHLNVMNQVPPLGLAPGLSLK